MRPVSESPTTAGDGFSCDVRSEDGVVTLRPAGELDMATVELVETPLQELVTLGPGTMVLDLRGLTFLDSTGISLLVRWQRRAHADGFAFHVVMGDERVRRPLEITGVLSLLEVVPAPGA